MAKGDVISAFGTSPIDYQPAVGVETVITSVIGAGASCYISLIQASTGNLTAADALTQDPETWLNLKLFVNNAIYLRWWNFGGNAAFTGVQIK
ncbi:MAG: hypothetical protein [Circular genetic element sp.]|jgi:hypothetical protein|nr:MAG: hypothetical protein [Circular genetic element sp.]|tara:strand:- start:1410 stop:1688 length:279 start_codon:yes stop_codon:yes gene_type:complete